MQADGTVGGGGPNKTTSKNAGLLQHIFFTGCTQELRQQNNVFSMSLFIRITMM